MEFPASGSSARCDALVVGGGWYGMGHLTRLGAVTRALRLRSPSIRVALLAAGSERSRVHRYGRFDREFWFPDPSELDYHDYVSRTFLESRQRFREVVSEVQPKLVLVDQMMYLEFVDPSVLRRARVVSLLDEREWADVSPGSRVPPAFCGVDEVVFVDALPTDTGPLEGHQHRVGFLSGFHETSSCRRDRQLILVNLGGGSYVQLHEFVYSFLSQEAVGGEWHFVVCCGPLTPPVFVSRLRHLARELTNIEVWSDPAAEAIESVLRRARACINGGGMASTAECIATRTPFLVASPCGPTDHVTLRAKALEDAGFCTLVELADPVGGIDVHLIFSQTLALDPPWGLVSARGCEHVAWLLASWLETRVSKVSREQVDAVVLVLPSASKNHLDIPVRPPPEAPWRVVVVHIDPGASESPIVMESERDRVARLLSLVDASVPALVGGISMDRMDDEFLAALPIPGELYIWADYRPRLLERDVAPVEPHGTPDAFAAMKIDMQLWCANAERMSGSRVVAGFSPMAKYPLREEV